MVTLGWIIVPFLAFATHASAQVSTLCGAPPSSDVATISQASLKPKYETGSKVRYQCGPDYTYSGPSFILCKNGQWTPIGCEKRQCGHAGELLNGHFEYQGSAVVGDKVVAQCYEGYALNGRQYMTCTASGWSGDRPSCEKGTCKAPKAPTRGMIKDLKSVYATGARLNFSCDDIHRLSGSNTTTCKPDGTWTTGPPKCTLIKCPPLNIMHGSLSNHRWRATSMIKITCDKGYERRGPGQVTCSRSGKWVEEIPTCEPEGGITCPAPSVTDGVKTSGDVSVYHEGDAVTFTCSEGFLLTGSPQVTCGPDSQWLPQLPECRPPGGDCGVPPFLSNAHLADSYRSQTSFPPGSRVRYVCAIGYVRERGSTYRTCNQGWWSPLQLTCERKSCGSAGQVNNGRLIYSGSEFGDSARVECNKGFQLVGQGTRNCLSQGWDGRVPVCEVVQCAEPPEVVNAERIGAPEPPYVYSSVIRYRCLVGDLVGERDIDCTSDGLWSTPTPECREREINCPAPSVTDGVKTSGDVAVYRVRDAVTFTCSEGFLLTGSPQVTCGPDGRWLPQLPECTPSSGDCGVPPFLSNAHLADSYRSQTSFPPGSRVRYVCHVGYVRERGSSYRTCNQGRWTPLQMTCERKSCGSAGQVNNGRFVYSGSEFGDSARVECNKGHQLVGQGTRNCLSGGWDGRVPVCEVVQCAEPPAVVNAERIGAPEPPYVYSSVIRYRCLVGNLVGERDIYCTSDGLWSTPTPECREREITCRPPSVTDGVKTSGDVSVYRVRDAVTFTCSEGFLLTGSPQVTCGPDGRWLPQLPECTPPGGVTCPYPYVRNAQLSGPQAPHVFGDSVAIYCHRPLRIYGAHSVTCGRDGNWTPALPTCYY